MSEQTAHQAEIERWKKWVADLQSGMYVNCVYCGHRYGPAAHSPLIASEVLKQHIEACPEHPLWATKRENARLREALIKYGAHARGCAWYAQDADGSDAMLECNCGMHSALRPRP